jgi:nitroimidazol reductase NimA-like FMN-containing flavoprotein (pyridoxamine 5'-phosphate oxidase superfamily)
VKLYDPRTQVEVIDRRECLALLEGEVLGRLGVLDGGSPLVLPMNYALHGDEVIFRTGPGTKLDAARGRPACFEIDGFDRQGRSGWSVVVRGRLEEVTRYDSALLEVVADLAEPWMQAPRPNVLRLVPTTITGRRIAPRPIEAT